MDEYKGGFLIAYQGKVQPQQRPRHSVVKTKDGRVFSHTYEDAKSRDFKASLHLIAQERMKGLGKDVIDTPLAMKIMVDIKIPKSFSKKKTALAMDGAIAPSVKPDIDNILKSVMDAFNGVVYTDDKLVTDVAVQKRYSKNDGLIAEILPYNNEDVR